MSKEPSSSSASMEHVTAFRALLEEQSAQREALIEKLRNEEKAAEQEAAAEKATEDAAIKTAWIEAPGKDAFEKKEDITVPEEPSSASLELKVKDARIKEMEEQIELLRALLQERKANEEALKEDMTRQIEEAKKTTEEKAAEDAAIKAAWIEALGKDAFEKKEEITVPHLLNLNPEERLAETLIYKLKEGLNVAGCRNKEKEPDLEFSGMGMMKEHCKFIWEGNSVKLINTAPGAKSFVNGVPLEDEGERVELKHNDRVWLGNNCAFRFAFPGQEDKVRPLPDGFENVDYYLAESELKVKDVTVKEMQEQIEELRALLQERKANEEALKEDMKRQIEEAKKTTEEKAAEDAAIKAAWIEALGKDAFEKKEEITVPHLLNLNPEERLAETLIYKLKEGLNVAGCRNKDKEPDLEFSGMGMMKEHCTMTWTDDKVVLKITAGGARSLVNGNELHEGEELELKHNDRVWLGNNCAFRFAFPGQEDKVRPLPDGFENVDYFMAESEIAAVNQEKLKARGVKLTSVFNAKLSEALRKIDQANIICADLDQDLIFQPKIIAAGPNGEKQIDVSVMYPDGAHTWPYEKFEVRLIEMVRLWEQWQNAVNCGDSFELPKDDKNPFTDNEYQAVALDKDAVEIKKEDTNVSSSHQTMQEEIERLRALLKEQTAKTEAFKDDVVRKAKQYVLQARKKAQDEMEEMRQKMQKEIDELKKNQKE